MASTVAVCVRYSGKHLVHNFLLGILFSFFKNIRLRTEINQMTNLVSVTGCFFLSLRIYPCTWKAVVSALKITVVIKSKGLLLGRYLINVVSVFSLCRFKDSIRVFSSFSSRWGASPPSVKITFLHMQTVPSHEAETSLS